MKAEVTLKNLRDGHNQVSLVDDIDNKYCLNYIDSDNVPTEICIYEDGLCLFRQTNEYLLELNLKSGNYAKISSEEGIIRFDVKVLDFRINSDILIMRYLIEDEERVIAIRYY